MLEVLAVSLNKTALVGFVVYLIGAVLLFMLFQFVYTRITPHKEFELIRSGNVAAAIALARRDHRLRDSGQQRDCVFGQRSRLRALGGDCRRRATAGVPRHRPGAQRHVRSASPTVKSLRASTSPQWPSASACSTPRA